jgi:alpha-L-rhamnosidase
LPTDTQPNAPTPSVELPGIGRWPLPGEPRRAERDDRSHLPAGPAASLLAEATWIAFPEGEVAAPGERPAYEFTATLALGAAPDTATLAVTAHGVYEAFVNGVRVCDVELTPGPSAYHATLYVQSYDVRDLLRAGNNEVRLVLSDGWFRGQMGFGRVADHSGTRTAVVARLAGEVPGAPFALVTDPSWRVAVGAVTAADLMEGEIHDLRRLGRLQWTHAVASDDPLCTDASRLEFSPAPPVRRTRQFPAVSVKRLASGRQVVDFGQNLNGWVRLANLGPEGTTTTVLHAEHLRPEDGDVDLSAFAAMVDGSVRLSPGQRDRVTSRGVTGDVFEPRHSTKGFRYVAVDGRDDEFAPADLTAVEVRSDLTRTGWFACSNPDLVRLHEVAYETWRANSCGVPTDCPTRERAGFTGDYQIFVGTAAYLEDVRGFSAAWLRAVVDEQFDTGVVPNVVPVPGVFHNPDVAPSLEGPAGWGDACTIVPWELYQAYGDAGILADLYPTMRRWVDHVAEVASGFRHHTKAGLPVRPHDRYLWDAGFQWGEWLEPGQQWRPTDDHGVVATAYYAWSARLVARVASLLGDAEAEASYSALADQVVDAWRSEYWRDGRLTQESQANYVRALTLGLVPDEERDTALSRLVELVHEADDHLSTGFLSTPWLLPLLADGGHADLAYKVLFQDDIPGWLIMLRRDATTVWEAWEGVHDDGTAHGSLSHYSKGGVIAFFHSHIAGLRRLEPGWRRFLVKPVPGAGITWAETALDSAAGRIEVAWRLAGDRMTCGVTVPDGATARVELPGAAAPVEIGPGRHHLTNAR